MLCSFHPCIQWHQIGSFKLAMVGILTPQSLVYVNAKIIAFSESQLLNIYRETTATDSEQKENTGWSNV